MGRRIRTVTIHTLDDHRTQMKKIPIKVISTQDQDILQIRFFPTDICNFSCSYCFPGSGNINKYRYPKNIDTVVKNFRTLFDSYTEKLNKTKFHLIIVGGGEPTMWPHIEQFCKEIKETHNVNINIISNGSRTIRWWGENSKYFDSVTLSCHHEFVDIDHYINVADLLFSKGVKVNALMIMDAKAWDKCVGYVDRMKNSKESWFIEAKAVVDAPGQGMDIYTADLVFTIYTNPNGVRIFDTMNTIVNTIDLYYQNIYNERIF